MTVSAVSANENSTNLTDFNQVNILTDSYTSETPNKLEIGNNDDNLSYITEDNILKENSDFKTNGDFGKVKLTANDITSTYGKTVIFSVKVTDSKKNILKNKFVTFKVVGKTFNMKSDDRGRALIKLKLNAGKYNVRFSCENISGFNTITVKNAYKITVYKWKSGADVKNNKKIKSHIPKSVLVKKIVKAAKKGTPMIKFKGGNGKRVFITAGFTVMNCLLKLQR